MKRQLLYLGEINDAQRAQWCSALDVLDGSNGSFSRMSLFPGDRAPPPEIAKKEADNAWRLVDIHLPEPRQPVSPDTFLFSLNRQKLRKARRSEGTNLLRTNLVAENPEELWKQYIVFTEVEQAFKELKNDLDIRPVSHHRRPQPDPVPPHTREGCRATAPPVEPGAARPVPAPDRRAKKEMWGRPLNRNGVNIALLSADRERRDKDTLLNSRKIHMLKHVFYSCHPGGKEYTSPSGIGAWEKVAGAS